MSHSHKRDSKTSEFSDEEFKAICKKAHEQLHAYFVQMGKDYIAAGKGGLLKVSHSSEIKDLISMQAYGGIMIELTDLWNKQKAAWLEDKGVLKRPVIKVTDIEQKIVKTRTAQEDLAMIRYLNTLKKGQSFMRTVGALLERIAIWNEDIGGGVRPDVPYPDIPEYFRLRAQGKTKGNNPPSIIIGQSPDQKIKQPRTILSSAAFEKATSASPVDWQRQEKMRKNANTPSTLNIATNLAASAATTSTAASIASAPHTQPSTTLMPTATSSSTATTSTSSAVTNKHDKSTTVPRRPSK